MPKTQTRKTKHHYDINDRIFEIIIGRSMVYSCAFFENESDDLEAAQQRKIETTIDRLFIPDDEDISVLDIGCGWGALACAIARRYPRANVLGVSISEGQIAYAEDELKRESEEVRKRISFELVDFDHLSGRKFDRVVSVGMLEHVGRNYLGQYFTKIKECLEKGGIAVVHSIVTQHPTPKNSWVDRYVFTGAYVPQTSEVIQAIEYSDMTMKNIFIHEGENYRLTLKCWMDNLVEGRSRFDELVGEILSSKDMSGQEVEFEVEKAYRIWEFYLSATQRFFRRDMYNNNVCQFKMIND